MPKRISKEKRPQDVNQLAHHLVELSTQDATPAPSKTQISAFMAEMGRKGGKIGGKRRLETMTPTQRRRVAKKAALTRWKKTGH